MKRVLSLVLPLLAAFLGGCAMGWNRPNTTEAEFYSDRLQCEQQANSMYPVVLASTGSGYQAPATTNCTTYGSQTNCTTMPGRFTPAPQWGRRVRSLI